MRRFITAAAACAAACAVLGGTAAAHPISTGRYTAPLYVVTDDGRWLIAEETNGKTDDGMYDYSSGFNPFEFFDMESTVDRPANTITGLQVHDTCEGIFNDREVGAWQGEELFYDYVPWQTTAAGIRGEPKQWLSWLAKARRIDLAKRPKALPAYCRSLGGRFVPADTVIATG